MRVPASSIIDFYFQDLLPTSLYGMASDVDSMERLVAWKRDEFGFLSGNSDVKRQILASGELIETYFVGYSGGFTQIVAASSSLVSPFTFPNPPVGAHTGIIPFAFSGGNFWNQFPLSHTNQLLLNMQNKYSAMNNDIRKNASHSIVEGFPVAFGGQTHINSSGTPIPAIPIETLAKFLDLSVSSTGGWIQYYPDMLRVASGIPVSSGAGPIFHTLKQLWYPKTFSDSIALNSSFRGKTPNNITPGQRQGCGNGAAKTWYLGSNGGTLSGNTVDALVYFGTSYDKDIDVAYTITCNKPTYQVIDVDSGVYPSNTTCGTPNYDFGHSRVAGNAELRNYLLIDLKLIDATGVRNLSKDSSGVYFGNAILVSGLVENVGSGIITIKPSDLIYRDVSGTPSGSSWSSLMTATNLDDLHRFFKLQLNTTVDMIASGSVYDSNYIETSGALPLSTKCSVSINGDNVPFTDPTVITRSGSPFVELSLLTLMDNESWTVRSGELTYDITGNLHVAYKYYLEGDYPAGTGFWLHFGYDWILSLLGLGVWSKDKNGCKFLLTNYNEVGNVDPTGGTNLQYSTSQFNLAPFTNYFYDYLTTAKGGIGLELSPPSSIIETIRNTVLSLPARSQIGLPSGLTPPTDVGTIFPAENHTYSGTLNRKITFSNANQYEVFQNLGISLHRAFIAGFSYKNGKALPELGNLDTEEGIWDEAGNPFDVKYRENGYHVENYLPYYDDGSASPPTLSIKPNRTFLESKTSVTLNSVDLTLYITKNYTASGECLSESGVVSVTLVNSALSPSSFSTNPSGEYFDFSVTPSSVLGSWWN